MRICVRVGEYPRLINGDVDLGINVQEKYVPLNEWCELIIPYIFRILNVTSDM